MQEEICVARYQNLQTMQQFLAYVPRGIVEKLKMQS